MKFEKVFYDLLYNIKKILIFWQDFIMFIISSVYMKKKNNCKMKIELL